MAAFVITNFLSWEARLYRATTRTHFKNISGSSHGRCEQQKKSRAVSLSCNDAQFKYQVGFKPVSRSVSVVSETTGKIVGAELKDSWKDRNADGIKLN